jgi:hypothetical protein
VTCIEAIRALCESLLAALRDPLVICSLLSFVVVAGFLISAVRTKLWGLGCALAVYLLIVNVAAWQIRDRIRRNIYSEGQAVNYLADSKLQENTLLIDRYLREPIDLPPGYFWLLPSKADMEGKYLTKLVEAGKSIDPRSLRNLPLSSGTKAFAVPEGADLSKLIDAGATVQWCNDEGACLPEKATVKALLCGDNARTHCIVLVDVSDAIAGKITPKHKIKLLSMP